jgi:hypothetical protein
MKNKFAKHYEANSRIYDDMVKAGKLDIHDLMAAGNLGGKYSYAEQDEANNRINEYVKTFLKKNEGNETAEKFASSFPVVQEFKPDPKDWQDYDQEQMGRLAESLHYNWNNKDDRSALMKQLQGQTIFDNKKKVYEEYKKEHPAVAWLNENIFAPNSSERSRRGEDITNKDVTLDALNAASFLTPGGVGKSALARGLTLGADVAANAALGVAEDKNLDRELGWHNIVAPALGAGLGQSVEAAPKLVKQGVDWISNGTGLGKASKRAEDVLFENPVVNAITDKVGNAKQVLNEAAEEGNKIVPPELRQRWFRKNTNQKNFEKFADAMRAEGKEVPTPEQVKKIRQDNLKAKYANEPEKLTKDFKSGSLSRDDYDMIRADKNFSTVLEDYQKNLNKSAFRKGAEKFANAQIQGAIKQTGRGAVTAKQNQARHESKEERNDIDWFKEHYARDWENKFAPHGNENEPIMKAYREWQEEQEKKKQKRPSIREVM